MQDFNRVLKVTLSGLKPADNNSSYLQSSMNCLVVEVCTSLGKVLHHTCSKHSVLVLTPLISTQHTTCCIHKSEDRLALKVLSSHPAGPGV